MAKKKNIVRIDEETFSNLIKECVKSILMEIDTVKPKRGKHFDSNMKWLKNEYPERWTDDIDSDVPEDWLSDGLFRYAHMGGKINATKAPEYDENGFDPETGLHRDTKTNRDKDGYNILGINKKGFTRAGKGLSSYDSDGYEHKANGLNTFGTMFRDGSKNWDRFIGDFIRDYKKRNKGKTSQDREKCWSEVKKKFGVHCRYDKFRKIYDSMFKTKQDNGMF